jgi:hypothetical protein
VTSRAGALLAARGLVLTLLTTLACAGPAPTASSALSTAGKPVPPVELTLAFPSPPPRRHVETTLDLTLAATTVLPRVRAALRIPPEVRLTDGATVWEGPLSPVTAERTTVRVVVVGRGRFTLGASARILEGPYAGQVAGTVLYVDATGEDIRWSREPPD